MNSNLYLHSFTPIKPLHHLPQARSVDWILKAHEQTDRVSGKAWEARLLPVLRRYCVDERHILERWFDCDDIDEDWDVHQVYRIRKESPRGATLGERNLVFADKTNRVFRELYKHEVPNHLIHVTCTGYLSPSPAQVYFGGRDRQVRVTHAYHMGCYAAMPAIRIGMGLALAEGQAVDVVHTELCSLHLNSSVHTPEQMVVQTLFADGHIRYRVGPEKRRGFCVRHIKETMIPGTATDMTWVPDAFGMDMTLSRDVPAKVREALPRFMRELMREAWSTPREIGECLFAIHPGGPKIISGVQEQLGLSPAQIESSIKVLRGRGNMSSATLPHIWDELLREKPREGTPVISLAFGPGLTIFGAAFEVVA